MGREMSAFETIVNECRLAASVKVRSEIHTNEIYSTYTFNLILDNGTVFRHMYYGRYLSNEPEPVDCQRSRIHGFSIVHDALVSAGFALDDAQSAEFASGIVDELSVGR